MRYSVPSRAVRCHSAPPKPMEKRSTRTPQRRATQKWPNSWMVTRMPRLTSNHQAAPRKSVMAAAHPMGRVAVAAPAGVRAAAAAARAPEMAEFVDGHQDAEADQQPPGGAEEVSHGGGSSDGTCGDGVAGVVARAGVGVAQRRQRLCRFHRNGRESLLDQRGDGQETDPALKKG